MRRSVGVMGMNFVSPLGGSARNGPAYWLFVQQQRSLARHDAFDQGFVFLVGAHGKRAEKIGVGARFFELWCSFP